MEDLSDLGNAARMQAINEWIHSERDREILKRKLIDGINFEPLAEEFKLSVRQTKTIVKKGKKEISLHCL